MRVCVCVCVCEERLNTCKIPNGKGGKGDSMCVYAGICKRVPNEIQLCTSVISTSDSVCLIFLTSNTFCVESMSVYIIFPGIRLWFYLCVFCFCGTDVAADFRVSPVKEKHLIGSVA